MARLHTLQNCVGVYIYIDRHDFLDSLTPAGVTFCDFLVFSPYFGDFSDFLTKFCAFS